MVRLALTLYSIIGTTFAGSFIVAVLVAGYGTLTPILAAAAIGFVVAVPVSLLVAKRLVS